MASLSMRGAQQKATDYDLNRVKLGKMLPCANTYHMHSQSSIYSLYSLHMTAMLESFVTEEWETTLFVITV